MKSDSSEPKTQNSTDPQKEPRNISELLPISTEQDLDDINNMLGNFLGRAKKAKKKELTKTSSDSMEEHITSIDRKVKDHKKAHSSPVKDTMKEPFGEVVKPSRPTD